MAAPSGRGSAGNGFKRKIVLDLSDEDVLQGKAFGVQPETYRGLLEYYKGSCIKVDVLPRFHKLDPTAGAKHNDRVQYEVRFTDVSDKDSPRVLRTEADARMRKAAWETQERDKLTSPVAAPAPALRSPPAAAHDPHARLHLSFTPKTKRSHHRQPDSAPPLPRTSATLISNTLLFELASVMHCVGCNAVPGPYSTGTHTVVGLRALRAVVGVHTMLLIMFS